MNQAMKVAFGLLSIMLVFALGLYAQQKMQAPLSMPPAPAAIEPEASAILPHNEKSTEAPVLSPEATKDLIASLGTATTSTHTGHTALHKPASIAHEEEHMTQPEHAVEMHGAPNETMAHHEILSKLQAIDSRLIAIEATLQNLAQELVTVVQPPQPVHPVAAETRMPAVSAHEHEHEDVEENGLGSNDHGPMETGMHPITDIGEPSDETENTIDF